MPYSNRIHPLTGNHLYYMLEINGLFKMFLHEEEHIPIMAVFDIKNKRIFNLSNYAICILGQLTSALPTGRGRF